MKIFSEWLNEVIGTPDENQEKLDMQQRYRKYYSIGDEEQVDVKPRSADWVHVRINGENFSGRIVKKIGDTFELKNSNPARPRDFNAILLDREQKNSVHGSMPHLAAKVTKNGEYYIPLTGDENWEWLRSRQWRVEINPRKINPHWPRTSTAGVPGMWNPEG